MDAKHEPFYFLKTGVAENQQHHSFTADEDELDNSFEEAAD